MWNLFKLYHLPFLICNKMHVIPIYVVAFFRSTCNKAWSQRQEEAFRWGKDTALFRIYIWGKTPRGAIYPLPVRCAINANISRVAIPTRPCSSCLPLFFFLHKELVEWTNFAIRRRLHACVSHRHHGRKIKKRVAERERKGKRVGARLRVHRMWVYYGARRTTDRGGKRLRRLKCTLYKEATRSRSDTHIWKPASRRTASASSTRWALPEATS